MKKSILIIVVGLMIWSSNVIPPIHNLFTFIGEGFSVHPESYRFVTKDKKFAYSGGLTFLYVDSAFMCYQRKYFTADKKLYRTRSMKVWRFWHWGEYLFKEEWKVPYMDISEDYFQNLRKKIYVTGELYNDCKQSK
jgi:hypothetical protein